jgi:hypothetical protein
MFRLATSVVATLAALLPVAAFAQHYDIHVPEQARNALDNALHTAAYGR